MKPSSLEKLLDKPIDEKMPSFLKETNKGNAVEDDGINMDFEDVDGVFEASDIGVHFSREKQ